MSGLSKTLVFLDIFSVKDFRWSVPHDLSTKANCRAMSRSHPAHIYAHKHTPRGLVRSNIGFLARCPPTRADFPSQSIKSFPRVARIQRYHGTGVPNSSNSHYCPGLNLTSNNNYIWPPSICNFLLFVSKIYFARDFSSAKFILEILFMANYIN